MTEQIHFITTWLQNPSRLSEQEQVQVQNWLEQYPYFVPARYMEAAQKHSIQPFSKDMRHQMQLYSGNWLLFYQTMQQSLKLKSEQKTSRTNQIDDTLIEVSKMKEELLIEPVFTENYFLYEGINVPENLPKEEELLATKENIIDTEKSLMQMMGFDEWLLFLKSKSEKSKREEEDKIMLRSMWQREKLAAAMGEEDEEIPEAVFEMAINSIDKEDTLISESLAEIHARQGHYDKAIEIYRKLSLQNPQKKPYFAAKIDNLIKEKQS
jgi:hypothetical protein